jgi:hypothetical protein
MGSLCGPGRGIWGPSASAEDLSIEFAGMSPDDKFKTKWILLFFCFVLFCFKNQVKVQFFILYETFCF